MMASRKVLQLPHRHWSAHHGEINRFLAQRSYSQSSRHLQTSARRKPGADTFLLGGPGSREIIKVLLFWVPQPVRVEPGVFQDTKYFVFCGCLVLPACNVRNVFWFWKHSEVLLLQVVVKFSKLVSTKALGIIPGTIKCTMCLLQLLHLYLFILNFL